MKHDNVVTMVYQKQVDAGATYYSPPDKTGEFLDARARYKNQYPDIFEKVKIIDLQKICRTIHSSLPQGYHPYGSQGKIIKLCFAFQSDARSDGKALLRPTASKDLPRRKTAAIMMDLER